jgi:hypothetical protein
LGGLSSIRSGSSLSWRRERGQVISRIELAAAVEQGAPLCGLDPILQLMPGGRRRVEFCPWIVDAVEGDRGRGQPVRPSSGAGARRAGRRSPMWVSIRPRRRAARDRRRQARRRPSTARAYAARSRRSRTRDRESIPRVRLARALRAQGLGVLVLVKTSNPGSADVQDLPLADGRPHVAARRRPVVDRWGADLVGESGLSASGPCSAPRIRTSSRRARSLLPRAVLLPARRRRAGGRPDNLAAAFGVRRGALVSRRAP